MLREYLDCMTRKSSLHTVDEVIDAFGGISGCQKIFGGVPGRFHNYKAAGKFPVSMHFQIYMACVERGLRIATDLIGMTPGFIEVTEGKGRQREFALAAE